MSWKLPPRIANAVALNAPSDVSITFGAPPRSDMLKVTSRSIASSL
jgi:hypothetical protein